MILTRSTHSSSGQRLRLLIATFFILCLGSASAISAQDVPSLLDLGLGLDICVATVEQLHGQGRFGMGGLSRFSYSGLEGDDNNLKNAGLDPAVMNEVLGNRVTPNWLMGMLPLVASGENFDANKVAVLVVDDFPDRQLTFNAMNELPVEWRQQLTSNNIQPTFPLEVPVVTHGMQVFMAMNDMLEAVKTVHPSLKVSLHRVDISAGGSYRLSMVTSAIDAKVNQLKAQGFTRFVINMSFGVLPCTDTASGFDFADFLAERLGKLLNLTPASLNQNFVFDFDGRTFADVVGGISLQNGPVVYQDYGLTQYMTEELTLIDSVGDLLSSLLGSSVLGLDTSNLSMLGLQLLFTNYNLQSKLDTAYYIPVAASGNYADLMTTDKSLSPASLPHVISVGATLGENGERWDYSQAAQLLAPGSWYDYSGQDSFVAGTSFAAPFVSMIGALYLTYPDACNFDGVHPPLLNVDYDNVEIKPYNTGFDCNPMLGPNDPVQLLSNRSFETSDIKPTSADRWKAVKLVGDKRVVNQMGRSPVTQYGGAAFQFNGTANTTSAIWQNADLDPGFAAGDTVTLEAQIEAKNLSPNAGKIRLSIRYSDGTPAKTKDLKIAKGTYSYSLKTMSVILASPNVKEIRVQIMMVNGKGSFRVDGMSLEKIPASVGLVSVPAASGGDLRGLTR